MKKSNILTTIMFAVVTILLIAIVALGVVTVVRNNKKKNGEAVPTGTVTTTPLPANTQQPTVAPIATSTPTPVPTATNTPTPTTVPVAKGTVCLDPGHQAKADTSKEKVGPGAETEVEKMANSGATNCVNGEKEYEWNLKVAKLVQAELERRGYKVVLTRSENDVNISNRERALVANENKADVFVGIQTDAYSDTSVKGVYAQIAESDNPYTGSRAAENRKLADSIQKEVVNATGAKSRSVQNGSNKLAMLNWADMPACIMQLGYMSNAEEAANLASEEYINKIVKAVCDGIDAYFEGKKQ
ncbi:MAG: N-acetylmuramoyl-L-alanine amidase [Lachnospiraceae bacterium]|nr:N-acetylmuramoyl-L-alanine amidase [Lachnospiraceae bacterium]